jgi:hypothetical protein
LWEIVDNISFYCRPSRQHFRCKDCFVKKYRFLFNETLEKYYIWQETTITGYTPRIVSPRALESWKLGEKCISQSRQSMSIDCFVVVDVMNRAARGSVNIFFF